jgi:prepilin-type N-terminal cleavage/methylation domain-containing protein
VDRKTKLTGFTLTEIMISLTICSLLSLSAFQIFKADHKVFVEQEEVVDMQQNARVGLDQLIKDLRMAGAGVPRGGVEADIGFLNSLVPGDGGEGLPDTVKLLANFTNTESNINNPMPNESAEIKVNDANEFTVGAIAIISGNTKECGESAEVFQITHISDDGQNLIQHHQAPPWNVDQKLNCTYSPPSTVVMVTFRKYYIDSSDASHPKLILVENEGEPQIVADNVENLQLVYDLVTGETDLPDTEQPDAIRKATVELVARTDTPDPQWHNGVHTLTGVEDNYRRLTLQSDVQIRNLK